MWCPGDLSIEIYINDPDQPDSTFHEAQTLIEQIFNMNQLYVEHYEKCLPILTLEKKEQKLNIWKSTYPSNIHFWTEYVVHWTLSADGFI